MLALWGLGEQTAPLSCCSVSPSVVSDLCESVHGIFQARIIKLVFISFFKESSQPEDRTGVSCTAVDSLPFEPPGTQILTQAGRQIQMFDGGGAALGLYFLSLDLDAKI